jgi:hypothetical protein
MEAICSSETSVDFQRITRRYIPEDIGLHNHRCENLKSYIIGIMFVVFSRQKSNDILRLYALINRSQHRHYALDTNMHCL